MKADILNVAAITPSGAQTVTPSPATGEDSAEPTVFEGIFRDVVEDISKETSINPVTNDDSGQENLLAANIADGQELPIVGEDLPVQLPSTFADELEDEPDMDFIAELGTDDLSSGSDALANLIDNTDDLSDTSIVPQAVIPQALTPEIKPLTIPGLIKHLETAVSTVSTVGSAVSQIIGQTAKLNPQAEPVQGNILQSTGRDASQIPLLAVAAAGSSQLGGQANEHASANNKSAMLFSTFVTEALKESALTEKITQAGIKEALLSIQPQALDASGRSTTAPLKVAPDTFQMQQPIDKPGWSQEFTHRLMWMNKQGIQQVRLQMNPANLGSIDVKIAIQNDQANISFLSQHGVVREAIEASLPRLREMMTDAGVKLENVNVSGQDDQQHSHASMHRANYGGSSGREMNFSDDENPEPEVINVNLPGFGQSSAVDYYA